MYYPRIADPSKEYDTKFVRDEREIHAARRLRAFEGYRSFVVIPESWSRVGDYWLLRFPCIQILEPNILELLHALQLLVKARIVHGQLSPTTICGGRILDFSNAIDMAGALNHANEYFLPDTQPPDKRVLGLVVQNLLTSSALIEMGAQHYARFLEMPRKAAILELIRGWKTWDLYDLSGMINHPLALQCRSQNPADRPTITECINAIKQGQKSWLI